MSAKNKLGHTTQGQYKTIMECLEAEDQEILKLLTGNAVKGRWLTDSNIAMEMIIDQKMMILKRFHPSKSTHLL
jgi:succinate dehydrogenase flavin-adding protein (antitoxin of CptAB toxin-antitoxin module)